MLSSPKCSVMFVDTKEEAEAVMAKKIIRTYIPGSRGWGSDNYEQNSTVSEWNKKMATKHLSQTLRLAAKTAAEHPSEKFVARLGYHGDPTKEVVALEKMGVNPEQIVLARRYP